MMTGLPVVKNNKNDHFVFLLKWQLRQKKKEESSFVCRFKQKWFLFIENTGKRKFGAG